MGMVGRLAGREFFGHRAVPLAQTRRKRRLLLLIFGIPLFSLGIAGGVSAQAQSLESGLRRVPVGSAKEPGVVQDGDQSRPDDPNERSTGGPAQPRDKLAQSLSRQWFFEPSLLVRETWTDNIALQSSGSKSSDWVTELVPGISIRGKTARLQANLDYSLAGIVSARDSQRNNVQNSLNALGAFEAIDKFFFIEASAYITQQAASAFGVRPTSSISDTASRTETRYFSISPYLTGFFGSRASYELRFNQAVTRTKGNLVQDSDSQSWAGRMASSAEQTQFGWLVELEDARDSVKNGLGTHAAFVRGTGSYNFGPPLRLFARVGRELNDYSSEDRANATYGIGLSWALSERTSLDLENDKRFFGHSYRYAIRHRTPLSSWSLSASQDITTSSIQLSSRPDSSAFGRVFDLLATQIPDPVERSVRARQQLRDAGIPEEQISRTAFLTSRVFVDKRAEASAALLGARNTLAATVLWSRNRPVSSSNGIEDDFSRASSVNGRSLAVDLTHRLSPFSELRTGLSWTRNSSEGGIDILETTQRALTLALVKQLGPKTTGSFGLRTVRFDSSAPGTGDYCENAVYGSVSHTY